MICAHSTSVSLEHDDSTGDYSDYITIVFGADDGGAFIHTHSGSRHVEATMTHEELVSIAKSILATVKKARGLE